MVGGARKPASAGADTSTNVTTVEMTMLLSGPGRGCKEKTEPTPHHLSHSAGRSVESLRHTAAEEHAATDYAGPAAATTVQCSQEL